MTRFLTGDALRELRRLPAMIAARNVGWESVTGIEVSPEYVKIARSRLSRARTAWKKAA